jgi:predicted Zn-dependent protease
VSHRSKLPFHFRVVDSPVVNAFAVPGGYVYFTRGILAHFNNEAQMMGVLGHEIGHVTARHGAESYTKGVLAQIGLIVGMVASSKFAQFGEVASQGVQLLMLKNSRANESQSDKLGVEYSSKTGYDAREMALFFLTLQRLSDKSGARIPNFLSTHPDPGERHTKVDLMARGFQQKKPGTYSVNRDEYLRRLEGMVYGDDPKQGFVENNVFYHPELKFQLPIPAKWTTQNTPQQFAAASPEGDAMVILKLSAEKTPSAAAAAFITNNKLVQKDSKQTTVNGLPAVAIIAEQAVTQQAQQGVARQAESPIRIAAHFIQYNGLVYEVLGVSETKHWDQHSLDFGASLKGFAPLTDASKLNVKPEVVRIKTVSQAQNFGDALRSFGVAASRFDEFSILNGMKLTDSVKSGMLIKIVEKQ